MGALIAGHVLTAGIPSWCTTSIGQVWIKR
jgi:hypothetical protein